MSSCTIHYHSLALSHLSYERSLLCMFTFFKHYFNKGFLNSLTSLLAYHPPERVERKINRAKEGVDLFRNSSLGVIPIFIVRTAVVQFTQSRSGGPIHWQTPFTNQQQQFDPEALPIGPNLCRSGKKLPEYHKKFFNAFLFIKSQ